MNLFRMVGLCVLLALGWHFWTAAHAPRSAGGRHAGRITFISHGDAVDIEEFVSPEGDTLFDFTADW